MERRIPLASPLWKKVPKAWWAEIPYFLDCAGLINFSKAADSFAGLVKKHFSTRKGSINITNYTLQKKASLFEGLSGEKGILNVFFQCRCFEPKYYRDDWLNGWVAFAKSVRSLSLANSEISGVKFPDEFMKVMSGMINLQRIELKRFDISPLKLKKLTQLKSLRLFDCDVCEDDLRGLPEDVKHLFIIGRIRLTDKGAKILAENVKSLESLTIYLDDEVGDKAIEIFCCAFVNLKNLHLYSRYGMKDSWLEPIGKLEKLESLNLEDCKRITGSGFAFLTNLKKLRVICLEECSELQDVALEHLKKIQSIERLNLSCCGKITDGGLQSAAGIENLRYLNIFLVSRKATSVGVVALADGCPNLKKIILGNDYRYKKGVEYMKLWRSNVRIREY